MNSTASPPLLDVRLPTPVVPKGTREYLASKRLLPSLLHEYEGRFVAIHNEQVIDSGEDDIELVMRVHRKIGYVPIHVGKVAGQIIPVVRIPRYRPIQDTHQS